MIGSAYVPEGERARELASTSRRLKNSFQNGTYANGARRSARASATRGLIAMSSIVKQPALAAGRRRARGLRKLSSENISKAMDETAAQVTRIGLTFPGTTAFCFLSLFSPDSALLAGSEKISVPLRRARVVLRLHAAGAGDPDRAAGLSADLCRAQRAVGPTRTVNVDRAGVANVDTAPKRLIRYFSALIFYLLLPLTMLFFAWKAAVFPAWGSGLLCVAAGVIASHVMLPLKTFSWRSKVLSYRRRNCCHRNNGCCRDSWF